QFNHQPLGPSPRSRQPERRAKLLIAKPGVYSQSLEDLRERLLVGNLPFNLLTHLVPLAFAIASPRRHWALEGHQCTRPNARCSAARRARRFCSNPEQTLMLRQIEF